MANERNRMTYERDTEPDTEKETGNREDGPEKERGRSSEDIRGIADDESDDEFEDTEDLGEEEDESEGTI